MSRITSAGLLHECSAKFFQSIFFIGAFFYKWNREFRIPCRDHDMDFQIARTLPFTLEKLGNYFVDNWNFFIGCMWMALARVDHMKWYAKYMQLIEGLFAAVLYYLGVMIGGWRDYFFGGEAIKEQFDE